MSTPRSSARPVGARPAVIDIGTNAIRLLVAEAKEDGDYRVLGTGREQTRPGRGLERTGRIDPVAFENSLDALDRLRARAAELGATDLRVVATAALREALNASALLREVRERQGMEIDVLSAAEEARLALRSAARRFELGERSAIADIGGGSTEVVLATHGTLAWAGSLPVGAVRLTERFLASDPPTAEERRALREHVDEALGGVPPASGGVGGQTGRPRSPLVGSGGTFTALASLAAAGRAARGEPDRAAPVSPAELEAVLEGLAGLPLAARREHPGLEPERADIIVAGLEIAARLTAHLGAREIRVNGGGIRDGLLLEMLEGSRRADPA
ncbi:MAG: Ppx/GppA phosphatase family protein [Gemmatimonadota bacterium]